LMIATTSFMQDSSSGAVYDPAYAIRQLYAIPVGMARGNWAAILPSGRAVCTPRRRSGIHGWKRSNLRRRLLAALAH
jgi:hypothetical protein